MSSKYVHVFAILNLVRESHSMKSSIYIHRPSPDDYFKNKKIIKNKHVSNIPPISGDPPSLTRSRSTKTRSISSPIKTCKWSVARHYVLDIFLLTFKTFILIQMTQKATCSVVNSLRPSCEPSIISFSSLLLFQIFNIYFLTVCLSLYVDFRYLVLFNV